MPLAGEDVEVQRRRHRPRVSEPDRVELGSAWVSCSWSPGPPLPAAAGTGNRSLGNPQSPHLHVRLTALLLFRSLTRLPGESLSTPFCRPRGPCLQLVGSLKRFQAVLMPGDLWIPHFPAKPLHRQRRGSRKPWETLGGGGRGQSPNAV